MAAERFSLLAGTTQDLQAAFARDVRAGLLDRPKRLPCYYFYDAAGSRLFDEICALPEYYLTRAEHEILRANATAIAAEFAGPVKLVELGSGSATKTRLLIEALLRRQNTLCYVPIDIGGTALEDSSRRLLSEYPTLEITAVRAEYNDGLRHLGAQPPQPRLILWLGSSVGNLHRRDAAAFLLLVRDTMTADDRLLIGIDLRKDRSILEPAYDDARGVTARFNLNLLARINRDLGGHFALETFRHRAVYNEEAGRIEMYLDSLKTQVVGLDRLELDVAFEAGEPIHTENSYKYSFAEIDTLVSQAGFCQEKQWLDRQMRFSVNLLSPEPGADNRDTSAKRGGPEHSESAP
jgi:dimethylhistidine N-methyltransferase